MNVVIFYRKKFRLKKRWNFYHEAYLPTDVIGPFPSQINVISCSFFFPQFPDG